MPRKKPRLLLVDSESQESRAIDAFLRAEGHEVIWARDGASAQRSIDSAPISAMVSALRAPRIEGLTLLHRVRVRHPHACTVMVSDGSDVSLAVEAVREGAHDVLQRPVQPERLLAALQRGFRESAIAERLEAMERRLEERYSLDRLTGGSQAIRRVLDQIQHVAPTRTPVLIEGEDGTGKGLVARAIHQNSSRKHEPFVWLDCGSLDPSLIEAEIFGAERTGEGEVSRPGRMEMADGGTLFLDRVSELPATVQVKLLRAIQERTYERVGGKEALRADVRLLSASNRDMAAEVRRQRFREDLYRRLGIARIVMPPLRERREDIPFLVDDFIRELARRHHRRVKGITRGTLEQLMAYDWPGNVRELKLTIEGMIVFAEGHRLLEFSDLPAPLREGRRGRDIDVRVGMTVGEAERRLITATLRETGGDKRRAAEILGIGLRTLYRKLETYGIG